VDYRSDPIIAVIYGEEIGHLITEFFNSIGQEPTLGIYSLAFASGT
jgi:hypothetical protein